MSSCFDYFRIPEKTDTFTTISSHFEDIFELCLLAEERECAKNYKAIKFKTCTEGERIIKKQLLHQQGWEIDVLGGM